MKVSNIVIFILSSMLVIQSSFMVVSCQSVPKQQEIKFNGNTIKASPNQPVVITQEETIGATLQTANNAGGVKGAGVSTRGEIPQFNSDLPSLDFDGVGESSTYATIKNQMKNPANIFFVLSALALVAAIPVLVYINKTAGILLFAVSGSLLGTALLATYAPILFAIAIVATLAIVGVMYFDSNWKTKVFNAFKKVVDQIEKSPEEIQLPLKEKIKEVDTGEIKEVVTKIKKEI